MQTLSNAGEHNLQQKKYHPYMAMYLQFYIMFISPLCTQYSSYHRDLQAQSCTWTQ